MASSAGHGSLAVSSKLSIAFKGKKSEFPHVKNLKNAFGSPEIGTVCGGASTRKVRPVPGGESVMRLRLGRRLINPLPVA